MPILRRQWGFTVQGGAVWCWRSNCRSHTEETMASLHPGCLTNPGSSCPSNPLSQTSSTSLFSFPFALLVMASFPTSCTNSHPSRDAIATRPALCQLPGMCHHFAPAKRDYYYSFSILSLALPFWSALLGDNQYQTPQVSAEGGSPCCACRATGELSCQGSPLAWDS